MQVRSLSFPAFSALPLVLFGALSGAMVALTSCSSGGGGSSLTQPSCDDSSGTGGGSQFCVVSCNLGCGAIGCSISEIAQNQPITFVFSRAVNPATVNFTTIQIKTAAGEEPVGTFLVADNRVTFAPDIQVVGNSSFFGFKNGETYSLLIRQGGDGVPTVRSTSGQTVSRDVVCNLRVSRGIVDLDGEPPRATLVQPATSSEVARSSEIKLEFSEILDRGPFNASFEDLPVRAVVYRTVLNGSTRDCVIENPVLLRGAIRLDQDTARQISVLTLIPGSQLPSFACVEVQVTTRVRDVAGTAARPQLFRFTVEQGEVVKKQVVETFTSQQSLDIERSAGEWSGGVVTPARVGGTGRHGEFDLSLLQSLGANRYLWDLERDERSGVRGFAVPAARTITAQEELVTNGEFHFSRMIVPEAATIRVVGRSALRLFVRGRCEIHGDFDLTGATPAANYQARPVLAINLAGQPGGRAGAGGGNGGDGGSLEFDMGTPSNPNKPLFNGKDGGAGFVDGQHAYLNLANARGGRGSPQWPLSGLNTSIQLTYLGVVSQMAPSPGGGGGWLLAGGAGRNLSLPAFVRQPDAPGGGALDAVSLAPQGRSSLVHFLLGGAGGGGGGSHTYFRALGEQMLWCGGGGGGGGGGALALRVGRELIVGSTALFDVSGGGGATTTGLPTLRGGPATPGGGGSGGSVLMQIAGDYRVSGRVRALGGTGGGIRYTYQPSGAGGDILALQGGDGANGYVRVEAPVAPPLNAVGQMEPPVQASNVGVLTDQDQIIALQSQFLSINEVFPPEWVGYEIDAVIDGRPTLYRDDTPGARAVPFTEAVGFVVQGTGEAGGGPAPPTAPWRQFVGPFDGGAGNLNADAANYFRFQLILNRARASTIVIRRVTLCYRS
jgi:hypothetical protein